jgi:hypothetical protein
VDEPEPENNPTEQLKHELAPTEDAFPTAQLMQVELEALPTVVENNPAEQFVHAELGLVLYVPARQLVQADEPGNEYCPEEQDVHGLYDPTPVKVECWPPLQRLQYEAATDVCHVPAGQSKQPEDDDPEYGIYFPAEH